MTGPLPILCESCGYDVSDLAVAATTDPSILCSECGLAVRDSLPAARPGTAWQQRHSFFNALHTIIDAHVHPRSIWRRVRPESVDFPLWTQVSLLVPLPLVVLTALFGGLLTAVVLYPMLVTLLLLANLAIAAFAQLVARVLAWRTSSSTLYAALDHASCYWPSAFALSFLALISTALIPSSNAPSSGLAALTLALIALFAPPLLVLAATLLGLRALRYANAPVPTPQPQTPNASTQAHLPSA